MFSFFKFFGSLKWAVISILLLATVLGIATFVERDYGMRAVHVMIYGRGWFAGVLGLLALNVFCAAAVRYPWKRRQTGFVITHIGILILLFGSFVTQQWGVDGNLPVSEHTASGDVMLNELVFQASDESGKIREQIPFPESGLKREGEILNVNFGNQQKLVVDGFLPRLISEKRYQSSPAAGLGVPAVQVKLDSSRFAVTEWLAQTHPENAAEMNLGPAVISFQRIWTDKALQEFLLAKPQAPKKQNTTKGFVVAQYDGKDYRLDLDRLRRSWQQLEGTPLELMVAEYLPYAVVEKNQLISRSDEPVNPAVQLIARNVAGDTEKHYVFANYPEFNTLFHARDLKHPPFGLSFKLVMQIAPPQSQKRGKLDLVLGSDGKSLYYRSFGMAGDLKGKGSVVLGQALPTGWMDSTFEVAELLPYSVQEEKPRYVEYVAGTDGAFISGLRYRIEDLRAPASQPSPYSQPAKWLVEGAVDSFEVGNQVWMIQLGKQKLKLPFELYLEKFTVGTDPGTTKAASYQSQVYVKNGNGGQKSAVISMNEPLKYGGYTFYQASYQMEEGKAPISIFSVNRDPGRPIKYAGSLVMIFGILLMFYMNPHYWDKIAGRKQKT